MNKPTEPSPRSAVILQPGEGRHYPMGGIAAVFKADGGETAGAYSISEWWLEPHTQGPGAHAHPEDDVFYVIEPRNRSWTRPSGPLRARLGRRDNAAGYCLQDGATQPGVAAAAQSGA